MCQINYLKNHKLERTNIIIININRITNDMILLGLYKHVVRGTETREN